MAPALFPAFLLPQVKPTRLLRLALLTGDLLPLGLLLLPLELDGLLGPCARPGGAGGLAGLALRPLGAEAPVHQRRAGRG